MHKIIFLLQVKEGLVEVQKTLKMGDVADFDNFMSAVIDQKAFDRISGYLKHAKSGHNTKIVGTVSHKMSIITIFGHEHFKQIFVTKFDVKAHRIILWNFKNF